MQFVTRFEAEEARQQHRYCQRFELWRHCADARCRRHRVCSSDAPHCMLWAYNNLPREALGLAGQDFYDATPTNIGAPERAARLAGPREIYVATTPADAYAGYLRDQKISEQRPESMLSSMDEFYRTRRIYKLSFDFVAEVNVEFLYTPIVEVIRSLLPLSDAVVTWGTAVRWEGGLYFHTDIKGPVPDAHTEVSPGQMVYCADPQVFAIPFGRRPMPRDEERRRERPCHIWARLLCDVSLLARVKDGATIYVNRCLTAYHWRKRSRRSS
jgi:hypothetical protein